MGQKFDYDYIVIGSGFGGSVAALRLSEKGYKVLVLEKGKWLREKDFPKTNWNVKRWLWMPFFRFFGLFRLTFFRHVAVLSGVGVGGGSLVYANTMPIPKKDFFKADTWSHLADWEKELAPFYPLALKMRGAAPCPRLEAGDLALKQLAHEIGKSDQFHPTTVAVYFGQPDVSVPDPYFEGKGPDRTGCNFCGGCMTGCRYNSKNSLDKNYLHLAQSFGAKIQAESEVYDVLPVNGRNGEDGYRVKWKSSTRLFQKGGEFTSRGLVFAGGVMGTVDLMLKLKKKSLPNLSDKIGSGVRTNSESLVGVTTFGKDKNFSEGVAISSILNTDAHSHLEPVRYSAGSGIWRLMMSPMISGGNVAARILKLILDLLLHPVNNFRAFAVDDWSKRTQILLFMQSIDSTLRFTRGVFGLKSEMDTGDPPTAFIPESRELAKKFARIVNGKPMVLLSETLFGIPTTAHILGGAVMGRDISEGVIDKDNRVFGYENMYVCDGSMISANIGVNPSLTITALSERAMSKVPLKA
jgi:cholesterol oxidase